MIVKNEKNKMISDPSLKIISLLEELAANAWPAEVVQVVDGWRLRFNGNVTRRANSVWPNQMGDEYPLEAKLALVEEFYARRGCPARFQLCPAAQPAHLDELLAERGYTTDARTTMQVAPLETVLVCTETQQTYTITIGETFDERWFDACCQAEQVSAQAAGSRRGILQRIGPRAGYALLQVESRAVTVGLGVIERGWMGLFSLVTLPEYRRRGAATAVIHALGRWGQSYGVHQVYLQVMADNGPALALYARLGFETLYHYHYRELAR